MGPSTPQTGSKSVQERMPHTGVLKTFSIQFSLVICSAGNLVC